ncbi:AsmA family protein, partial [Phaeospirillum tilakii]
MTSVALKIAAVTLAGGVVAVGVVPALIDWSSLRPGIERTATAAVGWPVTVAGPISARLLPDPGVTLGRVTVGAAGFERVRLDLGLWPLLSGRIALTGVELSGGRLGGGIGLDGRIQLGEIFAADGRFDGGFTAHGRLSVGGVELPVEAEGGRPGGGATVPVRATLTLPGAAGGSARIEAAVGERQAHGRVWLELGSLARALPGAALPDLPLTGEGRLVVTGEEAAVQGITLTLGQSRAGGELVAALGRAPVAVDLSLRGGSLDLDQAPAAPAPAPSSPAAAASSPAAPAAVPPLALAAAPAAVLRLPLPGNLTFNLDLGAESVRWRGGMVRQPRLNALLDGGVLTISRFSAQLPGATGLDFNGQVTVEADGPAATGRLRLVSADPPRLRAWLWPGGGGAGSWPASARLDATLEARPDRLTLAPLTLGLDTLQMSGSLTWTEAVSARLTARGLQFGFDGEPGAGLGAGRLTLRGPSYAEAVRLLAPEYRPGRDGALDLSARLTADAAGPGFDDLSLTAGEARLIGQIRFPADGPPRARLAGGEVRLDPFLPSETRITPLARLVPRPGGGSGAAAGE